MHVSGKAGVRPGWGTGPAIPALILILLTPLFLSPAGAAEATGDLLWTYTADNEVADLAVSWDGSLIAVIDLSNNLLLLDDSGTLKTKYPTLARPLSVDISPGGERVVVGSQDGRVTVVTGQGDEVWGTSLGSPAQAVAIAAGGGPVGAGSQNYRLFLLDNKGTTLWGQGTQGGVTAVGIPARGDVIASGTSQYSLTLSSAQGEELWSTALQGAVEDLAISEDGSTIAVVTSRNRLAIFDREGDTLVETSLAATPHSVGISPDGSYVAAGATDGKVLLFSRNGTQLHVFTTGGQVHGVDVSRGAERVVAGSEDNRIYAFVGIPGTLPTPVTPTLTSTVTATVEPTEPGPTGTVVGPVTGDITIRSFPPGATISLDGSPKGNTPLTLSGLSPGPHTVVIMAEGYEQALQEVNISAGMTATIEVELAPESPPSPAGTPLIAGILLLVLVAGIVIIWRYGLR